MSSSHEHSYRENTLHCFEDKLDYFICDYENSCHNKNRSSYEFIPKGLLHTVSCSMHCVSSCFPLFFFPIHVSVHTSQVCLFGSMSLPVSLPISTLLLVSFISVRTLNSCLSLWLGREKSCSTGQTDTFWHFGFTFSSS